MANKTYAMIKPDAIRNGHLGKILDCTISAGFKILGAKLIRLTKEQAEILSDRLTTKMISLDKYQVVERNNMDKILKEQKFQYKLALIDALMLAMQKRNKLE